MSRLRRTELLSWLEKPLTKEDLSRLFDTVAHGFASEEPTNDELDAWAAEFVMGWIYHPGEPSILNSTRWVDSTGSYRQNANTWEPSKKLAQALQVVMETDIWVSVESKKNRSIIHEGYVKQAQVEVGVVPVYTGAFDEEAIARKIMLELHRRLGRGEA